jgi:acetylornithine/succinyldiaminopimelate/putrescine aminotransferase
MLGVGLEEGIESARVAGDLLERGIVVNPPEPSTIRLLPPLTIDDDQIDRAVASIGESLLSYASQ